MSQFIRLSYIGLVLFGSLLYAGLSGVNVVKHPLSQQQRHTVRVGKKVLSYKKGEVIVKFKKNKNTKCKKYNKLSKYECCKRVQNPI